MILILAIFLVALCFAAISAFVSRRGTEHTDEQIESWKTAIATENSAIGRILLNVSRPVSRIPALYDQVPTRQYKALQSKLLAADVFNSDIEVFIAVQAGAAIVGVAAFICAVLMKSWLGLGVGGFGAAIALYPYNIISKKAKAKDLAVSQGLPEFAELLQMPLSAGMGILPALKFTASRLEGPVADEVRNLDTILSTNRTQEAQAFVYAGERLGTPEAKAFFGALLQAQVEGSKIIENLASQAQSLRVAAFQRQRAEIKKLPVRMVVMFGLHLLPLLFVVALIPTVYALAPH